MPIIPYPDPQAPIDARGFGATSFETVAMQHEVLVVEAQPAVKPAAVEQQ
jgi:hypothetical protein